MPKPCGAKLFCRTRIIHFFFIKVGSHKALVNIGVGRANTLNKGNGLSGISNTNAQSNAMNVSGIK
jgi:hypothetical protein